MPKGRVNVYWTERHEQALRAVYEYMLARGIPCERNGVPSYSAIILYALQQTAKQKRPT